MVELSPKQTKAATLLASGMKSKDVASEIDCTPETISKWKKIPEFEAFLNQLRTELVEHSMQLLRNSVPDAIQTLNDIMKNSKSEEMRKKIAVDILKMAGMETDGKGCGAGIGKTNPADIKWERKLKQEGYAILQDLYPEMHNSSQ